MSFLPALDTETYRKNWIGFLIWGISLVVLGAIAISMATFTTIVTVMFLGVLLFISGFIILFDTFSFWWHKWSGFFIHLIMSLIYLSLGWMLIKNPVAGSVSFTFLLGIFYIVLGAFRIFNSLYMRVPQWGWFLLNGIITLILGILIMTNWPVSGLFIIGIFIGIDLIFCGLAYIMTAIAARA